MNLRRAASRLGPSLIAVAAGWAAAMAVTMPFQVQKIVVSNVGDFGALLLSLAEGTGIWGAWALAIAAGGWLFGLVPVILFVPEGWLLGHPRISIGLAALLGWIVVLAQFQVWRLFEPYHSLAVRMFIIYSLLLTVYTSFSALVYLRLMASRSEPSA
jgi:hypothetical protein